MWFVFRLRRKTNHVSSLLRERSERKTSVFNQKTNRRFFRFKARSLRAIFERSEKEPAKICFYLFRIPNQ
ncbi:MAG: hypothetical protein U5L45_24140 [Saprospiraceae bacterium]|nr:hypothetical protein [Saprospiraceae bacterium]